MSGHKELGRAYLERKRPDLAEREFRLALAGDPDDPELPLLLGHALLDIGPEAGRLEESQELAEEGVGAAPDDPRGHLLLARILLHQDRPGGAERHARQACAVDPEYPFAHALIGHSLAAQGRWREALASTEQGLELDPDDEGLANLRARVLIQLDRRDEVDLALDDALRRDPEAPVIHESLGFSGLHRGDPEAALRHYREAVRLDPNSASARAGLVEALKLRHPVYRGYLRFFLWLRFPAVAALVFLILLGSVFARFGLVSVANSDPSWATLAWALYWILLVLILMAWLVTPLFNALLRFDREGRHALDRQQVRQANWFTGWLALASIVMGTWAFGGPIGGMAAFVAATLVIPVARTAGVGGGAFRIDAVWTTFLVVVGAIAGVEHTSWREERRELQATLETLYPDVENLERRVSVFRTDGRARIRDDWTVAQAELHRARSSELATHGRRQMKLDTFYILYLLGLLVFTWFRGSFRTGAR